MSRFSANKSNTSQFYNRFNAGRNVNTSYFTNSQTPKGPQENKSQFDFGGRSQNSDNNNSDPDVDTISINNLSRDYVREQDPENAFR